MKLLYKDVKEPVSIILKMHQDDARVLRFVNEACERIINLRHWANMERPMSLIAHKGLLTLPPEIVMPVKFNVNGYVGTPYGKHYEYLHNTPGDGDNWGYLGKNLVDIGMVPSTYDCDNENPLQLILWSDREEAEGFSITIRGLDENGLEIRSEAGTLGETISWTGVAGDNGIVDSTTIPKATVNKFSRIIQVTKMTGAGYVHVATTEDGIRPATAISVYHPYETNPEYRRFRIHGDSQADDDGFTLVTGIFKMGWVRIYMDDDPVPVPMLTPVKLMAKSLWHYEHDEIQKGATLEGIVERQMQAYNEQQLVDDNLLDVEDGYGNGDIESV